MENNDDREPLLGSATRPSVRGTHTPQLLSLSRVRWCCLLLNLLCGLSESILDSPMLAIYEQSLCIKYYDAGQGATGSLPTNTKVLDSHCKIVPIQQDLATIRGCKLLFDAIPALLLAIPLGRIADRRGRKKVYVLSLLGSILSLSWEFIIGRYPHQFPLRWVWFSSLIQCIGGGAGTADAMLMAMAADSCTPNDRTQIMYYLDVSYTLAEIIGPFAASALMRISLWIPCVIGLALLALSLITVILMPEPWQSRSPCGVQGIAHLAAPGSEPLGTTRQHSETMNTSATQKNIILTMPQFFVVPLKYILLGILVQYSSARFRWELGETGVFRSETAIVELVQYIFLLPVLLRYLRSKSSSSRAQVNLKIVNYSIACLCIGSVCIALCSMRWLLIPAVLIFSLGFGVRAPLLAFLSSQGPSNSRGVLFSTATAVSNLGQLMCAPIWGYTFAWSNGLTGLLQGTPFFLGAVTFGIAGICSALVVVETESTGVS